MAKIINLDELLPEKQLVILDGQEHELIPASVEVYMQVLKARERMKHASQELEQMEQGVMLIRLCCPSIEEARLRRLPLRALTALVEAIEEQMADSVQADAGEVAASDAP